MFEKPTAADITTGKKLTKAANATRDSLLIPSHTTNKGASAIFRINWVWTVARERLDDVADPIRQLGQDLVRFVLRRRPVHARPIALSRANDGNDDRCDFKTVNR